MVASPVPLLARTVRGIEWVSAAELTTGYGASAVELGHRFVEFRAPLQPSLLKAGSVDDIFSLASRFEGLDHRRSALSDLAEQAAGVHVTPLLDRLASVRPPSPDRRFEVVASFLGRRNYTRFEIERAVGTGLEAASAGRFVPGPIREGEHPSLSWRVHLFDGGGFLGLRLAAAPLHRRAYRTRSVEGSLHPPLARAAVLLAGVEPRDLVLDPCCGAGTLPLEASLQQPAARLIGSDVDLDAVRIARANAAKAPELRWLVADAGMLPLSDCCVETVLTNPPWRRQVDLRGLLGDGLDPLWRELARVVRAPGRVVVLLQELATQILGIRAAGLRPVVWQRVSVSGAWTILALLVHENMLNEELGRLAARGFAPPRMALFCADRGGSARLVGARDQLGAECGQTLSQPEGAGAAREDMGPRNRHPATPYDDLFPAGDLR
jgi:23S rRNA G2445 N2-methylase RlmL